MRSMMKLDLYYIYTHIYIYVYKLTQASRMENGIVIFNVLIVTTCDICMHACIYIHYIVSIIVFYYHAIDITNGLYM